MPSGNTGLSGVHGAVNPADFQVAPQDTELLKAMELSRSHRQFDVNAVLTTLLDRARLSGVSLEGRRRIINKYGLISPRLGCAITDGDVNSVFEGIMQRDITAITVVPDNSKFISGYQRGDIGQPLKPHHGNQWLLRCPRCGTLAYLDEDKIAKNDDGTVSSTQPLHCHGRTARQRYSIERNEVKWL